MKKSSILSSVAIAILCSTIAPQASAELYNQSIVTIYGGGGNPDDGWTTSTENGITLGFRGKRRDNGDTTNTDGVYLMPTGFMTPTRSFWNFDFSAFTGAKKLDQYEIYVIIDDDPSVGINPNILDVRDIPDNSYGNEFTLAAGGIEGLWSAYAPVFNLAQQSHNMTFYPELQYDPNANATYSFQIYAVAKGKGPAGKKLASTSVTIQVGTGGKQISELLADLASAAANHGEYVSKANSLLRDLKENGVISEAEKQEITNAVATSDIGK